MKAERIDHVNIRIPKNGLKQAIEFYKEILGFEPLKLEEFKNGERTSFFFRMGDDSVINIRPKENFQEPMGKNLDHFCIVVDEEMSTVKNTLRSSGIDIIREGKPLGSKGRSSAVYIKDPFGYKIEIKSEKQN